MKCETCGIDMIFKGFNRRSVYYCPECYGYKQVETPCDHEYSYRFFLLESGAKQLKKVCTKCYWRDSKATKVDSANKESKIVYESAYQNWVSKVDQGLQPFLAELRIKQNELYAATYQNRMTSSEWFVLRRVVLNRDNNTCKICGAKAEQVHHLTYAHFAEEYEFELVSLCTNCHMKHYHSAQAREKESSILSQKKIIDNGF